MNLSQIVAAALGLPSPWQVSNVAVADQGRRLDITVICDFPTGSGCPECGAAGPCRTTVAETWHHHDFLRYSTYLHTLVPRFDCRCSGNRSPQRPWDRPGSKFIRVEGKPAAPLRPA